MTIFKSKKKMGEHYGLSRQTVHQRVNSGRFIELYYKDGSRAGTVDKIELIQFVIELTK